jgi:hypothetical protein
MESSSPDSGLSPGPPYLLEAYNFVGCDQAFFRWSLDTEFTRRIHAAQEHGHDTHLNTLLVIDELFPVFSKELYRNAATGISAPKRLITMGRFTGQGVAGGGQGLTPLENFFCQSCATAVILQCTAAQEASAAARLVSLPPEQAPRIQKLRKSEAIVFSAGWEAPIEVNWEFKDFGDYPSAEVVNAKLAAELEWVRQHNEYAEYPDPSSPPLDFLEITGRDGAPGGTEKRTPELFEEHYQLLRRIRDHPLDGLMQQYSSPGLGVSRERGNNILRDLKAMGAVTVREEKSSNPMGGRGRKIGTISTKGVQILEAYDASRRGKP